MNRCIGPLTCHKRALKDILIQHMQTSLNEKMFQSEYENHSNSNLEDFEGDVKE